MFGWSETRGRDAETGSDGDDKYSKPTDLKNHREFQIVKRKLWFFLLTIIFEIGLSLVACKQEGSIRDHYTIAETIWPHCMCVFAILVMTAFAQQGTVSVIYNQFILCFLLGVIVGDCRKFISPFLRTLFGFSKDG